MVVDLSDLVELKSYCQECIDRCEKIALFDVSERFRFLSDQLEELIQEKQLEMFYEGEPIPRESIPDD